MNKTTTNQDLLDLIEATDWSLYAQPDWNDDWTLPAILSMLCRANAPQARGYQESGQPDADEIYRRLLFALGDQQAGTYRPVLLPALPILAGIVMQGQPTARQIALTALFDTYVGFVPEPGYERVTMPSGETIDLAAAVARFMRALEPLLLELSRADAADAEIAAALLEILAERSPTPQD